MERIVVGVDGSKNSIAALRWAIEETKLRQASLQALIAWHYPYTGDIGMGLAALGNSGALERHAQQELDAALRTAVTDKKELTNVERVVIQDAAEYALTDAAKGADLLVVGSRGRGGLRGLLLGSVSAHCVHHATCPVVVVPCPH